MEDSEDNRRLPAPLSDAGGNRGQVLSVSPQSISHEKGGAVANGLEEEML